MEKRNKPTFKEIYDYVASKINTSDERDVYLMVYLCYADYLCNTGDTLFDDVDIAYVVKKIDEPKVLKVEESSNITYLPQNKTFETFMSIISQVNTTIGRYTKLSFQKLRYLIHERLAPIKVAEEEHITINNDLILEYHNAEDIEDILSLIKIEKNIKKGEKTLTREEVYAHLIDILG